MSARTLFDDPPAQEHSAESVAAAEAIKPDANRLRMMVLDAIRSAGERGMTDEEVQEALNMGGSTQRPRRGELAQAGLVVKSGQRRPTKSGNPAAVWVAVV